VRFIQCKSIQVHVTGKRNDDRPADVQA